jgi:membrane protease YdiL (CAAX protease family)
MLSMSMIPLKPASSASTQSLSEKAEQISFMGGVLVTNAFSFCSSRLPVMAGFHSSQGGRDLLIFNVLVGLAGINYLVKTAGISLWVPTLCYLIIWIMSLILLLWLRFYGGERGDIVDYDENLQRSDLLKIFGAVVAMVVVASVLVSCYSGYVRSAIYVPRPGLALDLGQSGLGQLNAASVVDDLLYNMVLVAPAEESMKLVGILALYRKTGNEFVSVVLPVGFWASIHTYQAYTGAAAWVLVSVSSAFISGLILFWVLKDTRSLLNAQVSHASYNGIVILATDLAMILHM